MTAETLKAAARQRLAAGQLELGLGLEPAGGSPLATNVNVAMVESDQRTPREIMTDPDTQRLIDFSGPVAVLMVASLHFLTDADNPRAILRL
jgi:hypothetical protein